MLRTNIHTHTHTVHTCAGYPPVEAVKPAAANKAGGQAGEQKQSAAAALGESMREVVTSWRTWTLAVMYFFVYFLRQGCTSWLVFYLLEAKGAVDAAAAAITVSGACGGFVWFVWLFDAEGQSAAAGVGVVRRAHCYVCVCVCDAAGAGSPRQVLLTTDSIIRIAYGMLG